ncbi:hypothetical protein CEXT_305341 [Caerostris extrusa]|uniref:Secreted protein n=1 Tax=Caerostris extrusa TaxID=172846 RepID=A0AAV4MYL7_CAEEX|nr:hypothetical protein CEXT_305341 [Caerostris extrusa]
MSRRSLWMLSLSSCIFLSSTTQEEWHRFSSMMDEVKGRAMLSCIKPLLANMVLWIRSLPSKSFLERSTLFWGHLLKNCQADHLFSRRRGVYVGDAKDSPASFSGVV